MQYDEFDYKLNIALDTVRSKRHRLIIILGKDEFVKRRSEEMNISCIDLNLILSEKLLDVPVNKRSRMVGTFLNDVLKAQAPETLILNSYEILFLPELKQDPIRLFEEISKERTLIVFWNGRYDKGILTYAEPWHREYREYSNIDAEIIHS
ncbi:MAG: BREX-3 system P-loop-containing protein BrxF [Ruminiclostridium sp.]